LFTGKNMLDPTVLVDGWRLEITGMVNQPRTWDYAGVQGLPVETRAVTFECIANGPSGHLMSAALWRGVSLAAVIGATAGRASLPSPAAAGEGPGVGAAQQRKLPAPTNVYP